MEKTLENRVQLLFKHYDKPVEFNLLVGDRIERRRGILKGINAHEGEVQVVYLDTVYTMDIEEDEIKLIFRNFTHLTDNEYEVLGSIYNYETKPRITNIELGKTFINLLSNDKKIYLTPSHFDKLLNFLFDANVLYNGYQGYSKDELIDFGWIKYEPIDNL